MYRVLWLFVYDVTNLETFENLKHWTQSIKINMGRDIDKICAIIIGNKIDSNEREVKKEDAEEYSKDLNYPYFETSAKTGENVDETIKFLVKNVLKKIVYIIHKKVILKIIVKII